MVSLLEADLEIEIIYLTNKFGFLNSGRRQGCMLARLCRAVTYATKNKHLSLDVFVDVAAVFNCFRHSMFFRMLKDIQPITRLRLTACPRYFFPEEDR